MRWGPTDCGEVKREDGRIRASADGLRGRSFGETVTPIKDIDIVHEEKHGHATIELRGENKTN